MNNLFHLDSTANVHLYNEIDEECDEDEEQNHVGEVIYETRTVHPRHHQIGIFHMVFGI